MCKENLTVSAARKQNVVGDSGLPVAGCSKAEAGDAGDIFVTRMEDL